MPLVPKSASSPLRWLCASLLALCCAVPATAQTVASKGSIVWVVVDWAPYMILKDGQAPASPQTLGSGSVDRAVFEVIQRMPEYRHEFMLANPQRIWSAMERGQNLCFPAAAKSNERLQLALFTPILLVPPPVLVFAPKQREALVGSAEPVSLVRLMREHPEAGRLQEQRAHGAQLDAVIDAHGQKLRRELMPTLGGLLRPLSAGLFGYTLEYPMVIEYAQRQREGELAGVLETASVSEAQDWFSGYVACTRNAWGRQVIADIDAATRKAAGTPAFRHAVIQWLPKDLAQRNAERMKGFYDARAKGPAQIE